MATKVMCPHCKSLSGVCTNKISNGVLKTAAFLSPIVTQVAVNVVKGMLGMKVTYQAAGPQVKNAEKTARERSKKWAGKNKFKCEKCGYSWAEKNY